MKNETKDIFYAGYITRYIFYFTIIFALFILVTQLFGLFPAVFLKVPFIYDLLNAWGNLLIIWIIIFIVFGIATNITENVVISVNGMEYPNIMTKISCMWEDIQKIEIVSLKNVSGKGEVTTTWEQYNIITSKGNFSLNKHNIWDAATLKKIYEAVIPNVQNGFIIAKEKVTFEETDYRETPA